ncbi:hypothetical protein [Streptomyces sp. NPDC058475]
MRRDPARGEVDLVGETLPGTMRAWWGDTPLRRASATQITALLTTVRQ